MSPKLYDFLLCMQIKYLKFIHVYYLSHLNVLTVVHIWLYVHTVYATC
nr:hypothetical protein WSSU-DNA_00169 [White spot syndrome virus]